jgi:hypothetical protein
MTRHAGGLRDRPSHLKQARDALVPQIVEVQIVDAQQRAAAGEGG